jgi:hypothetical protein
MKIIPDNNNHHILRIKQLHQLIADYSSENAALQAEVEQLKLQIKMQDDCVAIDALLEEGKQAQKEINELNIQLKIAGLRSKLSNQYHTGMAEINERLLREKKEIAENAALMEQENGRLNAENDELRSVIEGERKLHTKRVGQSNLARHYSSNAVTGTKVLWLGSTDQIVYTAEILATRPGGQYRVRDLLTGLESIIDDEAVLAYAVLDACPNVQGPWAAKITEKGEEESEVIRKLKEQIEKKAFEIETLQSEIEHLHWLAEELRKQLIRWRNKSKSDDDDDDDDE